MLLKDMLKNGDRPKIGYWYTTCCERDMEQIKNEETIVKLIDDNDGGFGAEIWPTEKEGLLEIKSRYDTSDWDASELEYWRDLIENADTGKNQEA